MTLLQRHVTGTYPAAPVAVFRMGIALAMLLKSGDLAMVVQQAEILDFERFAWVPAVDANTWPMFFVAYQLAGLALLVGWRPRAAAGLLAGMNFYVIYFAGGYKNHLALLTSFLVLLAFTNSGADLSLDARRHRPRSQVAVWPVTLIKTQLCVVYLFAGINKLNEVFWTGEPIRRIADRAILWPKPGDEPIVALYVLMGVCTIIWELSAPIALWMRGWPQRAALVAGPVFHVGMVFALSESWSAVHRLGVFALVSLSAYVLFEPLGPKIGEWFVRRVVPDRIGAGERSGASTSAAT